MSTGVHARAEKMCDSEMSKKLQIGIGTSVVRDLRKKQWVEFQPPNEIVEIQSWARSDEFVRYGRRALVGLRAGDVKAVRIERLCLSLLVSKTFKLKKVNKSFVPESISCFRIPIYVYEHFKNIMSISHIRIMGMLHICKPHYTNTQVTPLFRYQRFYY